MNKIRFFLALWIAKLVMVAIGVVEPKRGTAFSGVVALKICPDFVRNFSGISPQKIVFVTGTNGKSSTTNLLVSTLKRWGKSVAANLAGANMLSGVAVTLIRHSSMLGRVKTEYVVLETDERFLPVITKAFPYPPSILCVTNLQKDQVQRNGDPSFIYRKICSSLNLSTTLVLNNDEPISSSLAQFAQKTHYYGVQRNSKSFQQDSPYTVTMPCARCGGAISFDYCNIPNVGKFCCTHCSYKSHQDPHTLISGINWQEKSMSVGEQSYRFTYSAAFFMYCYAAVIAMSKELGVPDDVVRQEFANFVAPAGRMEMLDIAHQNVKYIRFKQENPDTLQSALDVIAADTREKIVVLGYAEIEDFDPYYTNTFYSYDCDFDALERSGVYRYVCFSKAVCYDAAIRLRYAGIDESRIVVVPSEDPEVFWPAVQKLQCGNVYLATWLHTWHEIEKFAQSRGSTHRNFHADVSDAQESCDASRSPLDQLEASQLSEEAGEK